MMRLGTWFWLLLAISTGFGMFTVKYGVQNLDDELARVRKQTVSAQREIRVLHAEWTYLTQPERLSDLNRQFVNLMPMSTRQLRYSITDLPLRPPPAPPLETVAAAEPAPTEAVQQPPQLPATPVSLSRPEAPASPSAAPPSAAPPPAPPLVTTPLVTTPLVTTPSGATLVSAPSALDALFAQVAGDR